jgi:predicted RNA-binding Zn-ribbon protein involved in translation (DUF1610 family)
MDHGEENANWSQLNFMRQHDPNGQSPAGHPPLHNAYMARPESNSRQQAQLDRQRRQGIDASSLIPPTSRQPSSRVSFTSALPGTSTMTVPLSAHVDVPVVAGVYEQDTRTMTATTIQPDYQTGLPSSEQQLQQLRQLQDNFLSAPYQTMMQQEQDEDPTVARARSLMLAHRDNRPSKLPEPTPGIPMEPTQSAIEPTKPETRIGRRYILKKPQRAPDLIKATLITSPNQLQQLLDQSQQGETVVVYALDCASCGAPLQVHKTAILVSCPQCDSVNPAATCRSASTWK